MSKKQDQEKRKNKKALFAFIALFASAAIIIGSAFAFFSDYITGNGDVTAGTLDISGSVAYEVNGTVDADGVVENFNPGDVVYVGMSVTNSGNKSAWLQTTLDLGTIDADIEDFIKVCEGKVNYATCEAATGVTLISGKVTTVDANKDSKNDIINGGSGSNDEIETNGLTGPVTVGFTILFDKNATNKAQGKTVDFDLTVKAMQYRNNPSPVWTTIEQI